MQVVQQVLFIRVAEVDVHQLLLHRGLVEHPENKWKMSQPYSDGGVNAAIHPQRTHNPDGWTRTCLSARSRAGTCMATRFCSCKVGRGGGRVAVSEAIFPDNQLGRCFVRKEAAGIVALHKLLLSLNSLLSQTATFLFHPGSFTRIATENQAMATGVATL